MCNFLVETDTASDDAVATMMAPAVSKLTGYWGDSVRAGLRDQRDSGRCLNIKDQAANRGRLGRHARPLRQ